MTINIVLTTAQRTKLASIIKNLDANIGYFPRKFVKTATTLPNGEFMMSLTLDQYTGFKNSLATLKSEADPFLDIFFEQGEADAQRLVDEQNAARQASAAKQTGLADLKEVTVQDIKAARPKVKVKAGSRKA